VPQDNSWLRLPNVLTSSASSAPASTKSTDKYEARIDAVVAVQTEVIWSLTEYFRTVSPASYVPINETRLFLLYRIAGREMKR
jgi:hypothetical protein